MRKLIVEVRPTTAELDDPDGVDADGRWQVEFEESGNDGIDAGRALDAFHQEVPIGMLEDFDIGVVTPEGQAVLEAEGYESYSYHGARHVTFLGEIDD